MVETKCGICGEMFEQYPSEIEKYRRLGHNRVACSRSCRAKLRTLKNSYVFLKLPSDHPLSEMTDTFGRVGQHRIVMAQALGRPLFPSEDVHHKNGWKSDNRIENLELWTTDHPRGGRVVDKLAWAHEIIALYSGVVAGAEVAAAGPLLAERDAGERTASGLPRP